MRSFEELKKIQEKHEEEVGVEKKAKQEAKEEAAKKHARGKIGYVEREEAMQEAYAAHQEREKMRVDRIEQRIVDAEMMRESEEQKRRTLALTEEKMISLQQYIKEIGSLVKGKKGEGEKEIAPEIIEAIQQAGSEHVAAKKEAEGIINELKNVSSDRISQEEIDVYGALQKKIDALVQKIIEIESNPDVVDLLFEEAKEEDARRESEAGDAIRQVVVEAALRGVFIRTYTPDFVPEGLIRYKRDFLERVCKQFIEEEAHAKGIDAIRGRDERLKALQELCRELVKGIDADDRRESVEVESPEIRSGYALRRMLKSGINQNLLHSLMPQDRKREREDRVKTYDTKREMLKEDLDAGISRHLKTLNLIRARSFGWNRYQYRDFVFSSSNSDWSSLRQQMLDAGSDFTPIHQGGGPFVSKKADKNSSKEIAEQFTKELEDAQNLEKTFVREMEESMQEEIRQLEERRDALARKYEEADRAEKEVKAVENEEKKYHIDYTDPALSERLKNTILNIEKISGGLRLTIGTIERMLENIGLFQFSQRKFQRGQIESKRLLLANAEKKGKAIGGLKERLDAAEKTLKETGRSYDIQKDLNRTISELKEKENRLKIFRAGER